jgi:hypothetical protein
VFHQRVNLENFIGVKMHKMLNKISAPFTIYFQLFMGIEEVKCVNKDVNVYWFKLYSFILKMW